MTIEVHIQEPTQAKAVLAMLEQLHIPYDVVEEQQPRPVQPDLMSDREIILAGGEMLYLDEMLASVEAFRQDSPLP